MSNQFFKTTAMCAIGALCWLINFHSLIYIVNSRKKNAFAVANIKNSYTFALAFAQVVKLVDTPA